MQRGKESRNHQKNKLGLVFFSLGCRTQVQAIQSPLKAQVQTCYNTLLYVKESKVIRNGANLKYSIIYIKMCNLSKILWLQ